MLTDSQKDAIRILYKSGKTIREIREITGYAQATIMKSVKDSKVKLRGERYKRINRAKLKGLPQDYLELKVPVLEIMKKYGIKSEQTFYRIIDEFKLPRHRQIIKPE